LIYTGVIDDSAIALRMKIAVMRLAIVQANIERVCRSSMSDHCGLTSVRAEPEPITRRRLYKTAHSPQFLQNGPTVKFKTKKPRPMGMYVCRPRLVRLIDGQAAQQFQSLHK
jgi:hypothetical protein